MSDIRYTKDHETILLNGDVAHVGISDYAQEALGDLVFVELPEIGKTISKGDECAVVESVKTAAEVYSPVSGEIVEVNEAMESDLEKIKEPLSADGWIVKLKVSDESEISELMDEAAYQEYKDSLD